ncbi:hypothetical protein LCGC14_0832940 [marine sediment metagenome]|uniref:Uncharacterized protein n=1 Tax=marine sediment metagenome TaxID=412755 RepID=A0A0F9S062_9ZZZZ
MGVIIVDGKELPKVRKFMEVDVQLIKDITKVFKDYGLAGSVKRVEFDCGTPVKPPKIPKCYRVCFFGPDDRPICHWVCL